MKREDIAKLEPKYTGNTRQLTEGEAAGILHDPANQFSDDLFEDIPPVGQIAINRPE